MVHIKKKNLKTMIRYHHTPITMAKIKIVKTSNADQNVGKMDHSDIVVGNVKWPSLWKTVWQCLKKLNLQLP